MKKKFEEKLKMVKRNDDDSIGFLISPRLIEKCGSLVDSEEDFMLYTKMEDNTKEFAAKLIERLQNEAKYYERKASTNLSFGLIFFGDFKDLNGYAKNAVDFIMKRTDEMIAIYSYPLVDDDIPSDYPGYNVQRIAYIYLNFKELLWLLDKAGIKYSIDLTLNHDEEEFDSTDLLTSFDFDYTPEIKKENEPSLKLEKVKK